MKCSWTDIGWIESGKGKHGGKAMERQGKGKARQRVDGHVKLVFCYIWPALERVLVWLASWV